MTYETTWGTPIGQDCISLDTVLCRWLGERLLFMGKHTSSIPFAWTTEGWRAALRKHGHALIAWANHFTNDLTPEEEKVAYAEAQDAMRWVAEYLGHLWD